MGALHFLQRLSAALAASKLQLPSDRSSRLRISESIAQIFLGVLALPAKRNPGT
jgi:hypothetical protein